MLGRAGAPKLSVVIPVFNELRTIETVLRRVQAVGIDKEIVVVDDGSTDGTRQFLECLITGGEQRLGDLPVHNIRVIFSERNRGKGAALRLGFREAKGQLVIIQDADLEYDPADYPALLGPIERGLADVVYGSRFLGGPHRVLFFWHAVGNRLLTTISNMFTNLNLSDVWTCYKVFKAEVLETVPVREDGFGIEPEITAKVARGRWRVYEVPISYHGRTYAEGKKITWRDAVLGLWCIVRYRFLD